MTQFVNTANAPSYNTLLAFRRFGVSLLVLGIIGGTYWLLAWITMEPMLGFNSNGYSDYGPPLIDWHIIVGLLVVGALIARQSHKRLYYWYRWVGSGKIVEKDVHHNSEYSVHYVVYVKGLTRAGTTYTCEHSLSHGRYELAKIGDHISFND